MTASFPKAGITCVKHAPGIRPHLSPKAVSVGAVVKRHAKSARKAKALCFGRPNSDSVLRILS